MKEELNEKNMFAILLEEEMNILQNTTSTSSDTLLDSNSNNNKLLDNNSIEIISNLKLKLMKLLINNKNQTNLLNENKNNQTNIILNLNNTVSTDTGAQITILEIPKNITPKSQLRLKKLNKQKTNQNNTEIIDASGAPVIRPQSTRKSPKKSKKTFFGISNVTKLKEKLNLLRQSTTSTSNSNNVNKNKSMKGMNEQTQYDETVITELYTLIVKQVNERYPQYVIHSPAMKSLSQSFDINDNSINNNNNNQLLLSYKGFYNYLLNYILPSNEKPMKGIQIELCLANMLSMNQSNQSNPLNLITLDSENERNSTIIALENPIPINISLESFILWYNNMDINSNDFNFNNNHSNSFRNSLSSKKRASIIGEIDHVGQDIKNTVTHGYSRMKSFARKRFVKNKQSNRVSYAKHNEHEQPNTQTQSQKSTASMFSGLLHRLNGHVSPAKDIELQTTDMNNSTRGNGYQAVNNTDTLSTQGLFHSFIHSFLFNFELFYFLFVL